MLVTVKLKLMVANSEKIVIPILAVIPILTLFCLMYTLFRYSFTFFV